MKKLNLTFVKTEQKTSKAGKPFTSVSIKAKEYGERFLSGFGSRENANWAPGQEVEVLDVREVKSVDGTKTYLNFEMLKKPRIEESVAAMQITIDQIKRTLQPIYLEWKARQTKTPKKIAGTDIDYPQESNEVNFDGINEDYLGIPQ